MKQTRRNFIKSAIVGAVGASVPLAIKSYPNYKPGRTVLVDISTPTGRQFGINYGRGGSVYDLLVFDRALTDEEIAKEQNCLKEQYNLT